MERVGCLDVSGEVHFQAGQRITPHLSPEGEPFLAPPRPLPALWPHPASPASPAGGEPVRTLPAAHVSEVRAARLQSVEGRGL